MRAVSYSIASQFKDVSSMRSAVKQVAVICSEQIDNELINHQVLDDKMFYMSAKGCIGISKTLQNVATTEHGPRLLVN